MNNRKYIILYIIIVVLLVFVAILVWVNYGMSSSSNSVLDLEHPVVSATYRITSYENNYAITANEHSKVNGKELHILTGVVVNLRKVQMQGAKTLEERDGVPAVVLIKVGKHKPEEKMLYRANNPNVSVNIQGDGFIYKNNEYKWPDGDMILLIEYPEEGKKYGPYIVPAQIREEIIDSIATRSGLLYDYNEIIRKLMINVLQSEESGFTEWQEYKSEEDADKVSGTD